MIGGLVVTMTAAWVLSEASQDFENLKSHSNSRLKCGDWGPGGEECSGDRGGSQRPTPAHGNGNGFINRYLYSVYDDESDNDNARDTHSCTHSDGSGYGHGRVDVDVDVNADAGGHRDGDSKRQRTIGGDSGRNNNVNNNSNTSNNSNSSNRNATPSTASRTPHVAQTSQRRIRHQVDEDGGKKTTTNSTFFALFVLILSVGVSINALPLDPIQLNLAVQVINACFAPAVLCVLYILASATEEDYAHISFRPEVGEREKRARRRAQYSGAGNNGYAHSNEDNSEDNNSIPNSEGCAGVGGDGSDNASHMHIHQRHGKKLFMRRVLAADQIGDSGHNANDSGDNDGNSYNNNVDSYYHPQSPSFSQPFLSQSHTRAHPEHSLFRQRHHYHHHHLHRCRYVLPEAFRLQGLYKCVVAFVFTLCSVVGLYSAGMGVYHQAVGGQG